MQVLCTLMRIGGWLAITMATITLLLAVVAGYFAQSFRTTAIQTEGEVVELLEREDSDGSLLYYPVFTFNDHDGQSHKIHSSTGSFPPSYSEGEKATIYYDPDNPKHAKLDSIFGMWGLTIIPGIISIVNYITGFVLLVIARIITPKLDTPPSVTSTE